MYKGEIISLTVAISWTACAMFAEVASKRMGSLLFNITRMVLSLIMLAAVMWWFFGVPYPAYSDASTWFWLSLSGFIGYVLGDYCLFNSYILIGSRYGQLLMTLAPPSAAIFGWVLLGESMSMLAVLGMIITALGIACAIFKPKDTSAEANTNATQSNKAKGIIYGVLAGIGQGVGLVLSAKGLKCYETSILQAGIDQSDLSIILPFAATAIRAVTGIIGFTIWASLTRDIKRLPAAVCDLRSMLFALGATITGPFIGVSLSLMATLYTSTGIAQTIMALTPVLILLPTYIFFHQRITLREVLGAIIAVTGVSLFFI